MRVFVVCFNCSRGIETKGEKMDSELLNVLILINNENNLVSLGRDCHLIQDMRDLLLARGLVVTESLYTIAPK